MKAQIIIYLSFLTIAIGCKESGKSSNSEALSDSILTNISAAELEK
ncbi:MAG: hypothetical protein IPJ06_14970 [Saprospiraceae bacterium]|nr:hypothetical protein [Saprospiraceae bacterium]